MKYLGHLVTRGGVKADPKKIAVILNWPVSKTIKQLWGFLDITGYYHRFVWHYATIVTPLTELLEKDSFQWTSTATTTFEQLKWVLSELLVLHLPGFAKEFILEMDTSKIGIGGVLMQDGHPLAYFRKKKMGPKMQLASTYVRELFAMTEAVAKWRQ